MTVYILGVVFLTALVLALIDKFCIDDNWGEADFVPAIGIALFLGLAWPITLVLTILGGCTYFLFLKLKRLLNFLVNIHDKYKKINE